jgi:hypothetical protein
MTDARVLVGRTVTKIATRDDRTFLSFVDRSSMDVQEIRLYLDGRFEVDPEPPGADDGELELTLYLRLGELPGLTVDGVELGPHGDLRVEFSEGTLVTAFGPPADEPPYLTWQLQER